MTVAMRLPLLLGLLTVVTGIVDAVSYLRLGHVFVANMTGNVVFLGFALGGAPGVDPWASIVAILGFLAGARIGTFNIARAREGPNKILAYVTTTKAVILWAAVVMTALLPIGEGTPARYLIAVVLAVSMGAQNAVARKLAVPDFTTTVLTMTLTALGSGGPGTGRRLASVGAMLFGAFLGGLIVLRGGTPYAVALAAALVTGVALAAWQFARAETVAT